MLLKWGYRYLPLLITCNDYYFLANPESSLPLFNALSVMVNYVQHH